MLDAQPIITADHHPSQETCTTKPRGDSSLPFILAKILSLLIVAYGRDSVLRSKVSVGLLPSIACSPVKGEFMVVHINSGTCLQSMGSQRVRHD